MAAGRLQAFTDNIRSSLLLAFDAARAVMLARGGPMIGWPTDGEAWPFMLTVAQAVPRTYAS